MAAPIEADYVVVGGGSAGCVLAARLSEGNARVVLLEAGPPDTHPMIHVPAGIAYLLYNQTYNWLFSTEPEASSGNRAIHWPRGRVLGGSGSINGMLYVRGNPADFDGWAQMGCRGWSYDDVLPFFKKAERYDGGDAVFRGQDGPLTTRDYYQHLPLTHAFVQAAQQAGFPFTKDYNGARQEGVGYSQMTRLGRFRGSTARAHLSQARNRVNLRVETDAAATRLLFEGKRCTGVAFTQHGIMREVRAAREVVVASGAVGSPHLLQVSGVGPAEHLRALNIPVVHDLPGVGRNLSDHFTVRIVHRAKPHLTSINQLARAPRKYFEALRYILTGRGALTFGVTSAMVFCRSREGLASPDLQLLFTPASYNVAKVLTFEDEPGMLIAICPTRPGSRGTIMAGTPDIRDKPLIRPNYLSDPDDFRVLKAGFAHARRIFASPALTELSLGEIRPGTAVDQGGAFEEFASTQGASLYHPVGTCKMGLDPMAVVDERLRVRGVGNLRVIDASVMPYTTTGNTNAPTIMIGEKGAAMMKDDAA